MARSRDKQTFIESEINFSDHKVAGLRVGVHKLELTPGPGIAGRRGGIIEEVSDFGRSGIREVFAIRFSGEFSCSIKCVIGSTAGAEK